MGQVLTLKIAGLYTAPNSYSEVPEGALLQADNIVINQNSVAEPRRGFDQLAGALSATANKLFFYQSKLFAHFSTSSLSYYNSNVFNAVTGTYTPPAGINLKSAEANQNLYFTSAAGVYKLDAFTATPRRAGAPKALDSQAAVSASASTWLVNNFRTAYRVVWGYKDTNNNLILGAPSARESIKNTAGATKAIDLVCTIPASIIADASFANWFYQVYRAAAVDNTTLDTEPSDEMGLVFEGNPTAADITNKFITVTDIIPDSLRGATLYTAQSQQGLANGNEPPPLANDIAVFKDSLFYAYTTSKHRLYITLLAASGAGIVANDTVTIGGVTYTAKAAETIASAEFKIVTAGSASQNIRDTALSLVRVINRAASSTVYAYYLSGPDDLPGKILLEERNIGGSSFTFTSSRYPAWSPTISATAPTRTSTNDTYKNGIFYSKTSQPEATPLVNFFTVGSKDKAILRIIPLRESLFVFKEDGIFRISENGAGFQVNLFDSSAKLLAEESCAVLNNQIFCLTDQGVCTVTDTGVSVISRPIETDILNVFSLGLSTVKSTTFGIAYESERKYILFLISGSGDTSPSQAFVWNTFTSTWVRWNLAKKCGAVAPVDVRDGTGKDMLYLGDSLTNFVNVERKALNYTDYADYSFATSISAAVGKSVTIASGSDLVSIGDVLYQDPTHFAIVTAINTSTSTLTTDIDASFAVASASILKSISTVIQWTPVALSNPAIIKQYQETTFLFKNDFSGTATASFATDLSLAFEAVSLTGRSSGLWGLFIWSESAIWSGENARRPVRIWVPRAKQMGSYLSVKFAHSYGYSGWQIEGVSVLAETEGSSRTRR